MGRDHHSEPLSGIDKKLSTKKGAAMGALLFAMQLFLHNAPMYPGYV
jgi:hypothetical protein